MENNNFEDKLKENIKNIKYIPNSVNEKVKNAFEKIDNCEKSKYHSKYSIKNIIQIIISLITIVFLGGNGIAFAKGKNNLYTWILNKFENQYNEIKIDINNTIDYSIDVNEKKITLLDMAIDDNFLIMGFNIKDDLLNLTEKTKLEFEMEIKIEDENGINSFFSDNSCVGDVKMVEGIEKLHIKSNNECILYQIYDISGIDIGENIKYIEIFPDILDIYDDKELIEQFSMGDDKRISFKMENILKEKNLEYLISFNNNYINFISVYKSDFADIAYINYNSEERVYCIIKNSNKEIIGQSSIESNTKIILNNKINESQKYFIEIYEYNGNKLIEENSFKLINKNKLDVNNISKNIKINNTELPIKITIKENNEKCLFEIVGMDEEKWWDFYYKNYFEEYNLKILDKKNNIIIEENSTYIFKPIYFNKIDLNNCKIVISLKGKIISEFNINN